MCKLYLQTLVCGNTHTARHVQPFGSKITLCVLLDYIYSYVFLQYELKAEYRYLKNTTVLLTINHVPKVRFVVPRQDFFVHVLPFFPFIAIPPNAPYLFKKCIFPIK